MKKLNEPSDGGQRIRHPESRDFCGEGGNRNTRSFDPAEPGKGGKRLHYPEDDN